MQFYAIIVWPRGREVLGVRFLEKDSRERGLRSVRAGRVGLVRVVRVGCHFEAQLYNVRIQTKINTKY